MKKLKQKIISIIILLITFTSIINTVSIGAFQANLQFSHRTDFYLTYNGARFYQSVIFYDYEGQKHYAYCLNADRPGAETERYIANVYEYINDDKIWRVMKHGFPYCSPTAMGLRNEDEAFYVTKMAVYCMIGQRDINGFGPYNGNDHVLNSLRNLVNIGFNGTETRQTPNFNINKIGNTGIDNINNNYLSQTFQISSSLDLKDFEAGIVSSTISNTTITDMSNNIKKTFNSSEQFKVLIPLSNIANDIDISIEVFGKAKTYPVFFALAPDQTFQNYAISFDAFELGHNVTTLQEKLCGYISITKRSSKDNLYSELSKGTLLEGAVFEIYNNKNEIVDIITTDEFGIAKSKSLPKGIYNVKEILAPKYYLINENKFEVEIINHQETVNIDITDENADIKVDIEKTGTAEAQNNENIYYIFENIANKSNVSLDNFTWQDVLPTDAVRADKIYTGIWNQELEYSIWYKTNLNDYKLLKDKLSTKIIYEIDFNEVVLKEDEYITEYEFRFGTVDKGFKETESPALFCNVLDGLSNGFVFTNFTKVSGTYFDKYVEAIDKWNTIIYNKIDPGPKLPKTGG